MRPLRLPVSAFLRAAAGYEDWGSPPASPRSNCSTLAVHRSRGTKENRSFHRFSNLQAHAFCGTPYGNRCACGAISGCLPAGKRKLGIACMALPACCAKRIRSRFVVVKGVENEYSTGKGPLLRKLACL